MSDRLILTMGKKFWFLFREDDRGKSSLKVGYRKDVLDRLEREMDRIEEEERKENDG